MDEKRTGNNTDRQRVLIADDSEMNCMLLEEMLGDKFSVTTVENGRRAIDVLSDSASDISLLLLDLNMPEVDGFEVLACMNQYRWIDEVPVIVISAETDPAAIHRAYDLGVTDFISRPFDVAIVRRRVENALLLSANLRRLTSIVTDQIYENQKNSQLMISILSHIVEFRNGESGLHVIHINVITEMILRQFQKNGNPYNMTQEDISRIAMASALHDIGKLSVPDEILNKPGRLTDEEFAVMKNHSMAGAQMLDELPSAQRNDPLTVTAYEICRWHHERYDGRGYPDGLVGDEIPIAAQVVALADVYDALTSERCYKKAIPHEKAVAMILEGQCGAFNPRLLDCLREVQDSLREAVGANAQHAQEIARERTITEQLQSYDLTHAGRSLQQLEFERQRFRFFADSSDQLGFTYTTFPSMVTFSRSCARWLGVDETIIEPMKDENFLRRIAPEELDVLKKKIRAATSAQPDFQMELTMQGAERTERFTAAFRTLWAFNDDKNCLGIVGRVLSAEPAPGREI